MDDRKLTEEQKKRIEEIAEVKMSDKEIKKEDLTEEQKANLKSIEELLSKKEIQERIAAMKTVDEAFALYKENGISFTEEQKEQIRKIAEEKAKVYEDRELTSDELQEIAGGWNWFNFGSSSVMGGILGALVVYTSLVNPAAWAIAIGGAVGAGVFGGLAGAIEETLFIEE